MDHYQNKNPTMKSTMNTRIVLLMLLLGPSLAFSQISVNTVSSITVDSASFFLQKGLMEKEKGRRMESLKNFEKAQKYDANNKQITAELASAYYDLRKYTLAIESYKKLVDLGETTPANYKQLMNLSFNFKKYDDVILYAGKLKEADKSEKISYYLGKVHYEQGNYGESIKQLNQAAKEDPKNAEVQYMLARCWADQQNYKQSVPYFQKAIDLDTSKNNWIYELGLIYYAIPDDKNALKYILLAGEKGYKRDNDYLQNLGIAYLNGGNLDQGVNILNEILKKRPSDLNILNMVAEAYYDKGKYQLAIDYWDQCLTYDKQNASALYMIGLSYQKKGEKAKGQQLCDKAIEMDPSLASLKQKKQMMGL
jgi:tetratricopeptide (TPR) repeat protein